ncbi:hypothetical protein DL93DRAFT_2162084 [Clavulina sp. PMI_390]|nr:hypothetical protein DL93DRAFT_2162084 [Clavulina sp. PMI_390]
MLQPAGTPDWLKEQLESTSASWPQDDFGAVQRPPATPGGPPEWRIKCYDCPGMLYKPGPGHTLDNFIVHLRNRNHRNNVSKRIMEAESVSADVTAADGA